MYEPYDSSITKPLKTLQGQKVNPEEEIDLLQPVRGAMSKLKDTFNLPDLREPTESASKYCYDAKQRQCIECAAKAITQNLPEQHLCCAGFPPVNQHLAAGIRCIVKLRT